LMTYKRKDHRISSCKTMGSGLRLDFNANDSRTAVRGCTSLRLPHGTRPKPTAFYQHAHAARRATRHRSLFRRTSLEGRCTVYMLHLGGYARLLHATRRPPSPRPPYSPRVPRSSSPKPMHLAGMLPCYLHCAVRRKVA